MRRATLAIAVLVALASMVSTASAAGGTPASLPANVASASVTHHPHAVRLVPVYRPAVVVRPFVVPVRPVLRPPVYVGPPYRPYVGYRPYLGGAVYIEAPYVSLGIGF